MKKFTAIITNYNRPDLVDQCLKSFLVHENREDLEVIIVDDASEPGQYDKLLEVVHIHNVGRKFSLDVIRREVNGGYAKSANAGLSFSSGEVVVFVNSDIILTGPILDKFKEALHSDPRIAVVGAKLRFPSGRIQHGGVEVTHEWQFNHVISEGKSSRSRYCVNVTGALLGVTKQTIERIGKFDENFFMSCDDGDYCLRAWKAGYRVLYSSEIEAIHLEGETRGNNPTAKKEKNPQAKEREEKDIALLSQKWFSLAPHIFYKKVKDANKEILKKHGKIEIGAGDYPEDGFITVDARDLPSTDIVCNIESEALPLDDNSVSEILTNHCIEHISWRAVPFTVSEWARVLKPHGFVTIRTPDLDFIVNKYLKGETTPEWPEDEWKIKELYGEVTPFWWAINKLYAGQAFQENAHKVCFTFDALKQVLLDNGFSRVERVPLEIERSPGELQVRAWKGDPKPTLLVKRQGALGDVIILTGMLEHLAKEYDVTIKTAFPHVFLNSKKVKAISWTKTLDESLFSKVIDLDLAYEKDRTKNIHSMYCAALGIDDVSYPTKMYPNFQSWETIHHTKHALKFGSHYVVIHPGVGWKEKTIPNIYYERMASHAISLGFQVLIVGTKQDHRLNVGHDLRDRLTLQEVQLLIDGAALFISPDSGLLHVATTTKTPQIALFTNTIPHLILQPHKHITAITAGGCTGCLNKTEEVVTYLPCKNDYIYSCTLAIDIGRVLSSMEKILLDSPQ